jgi:type II secretory ATPase GspE/PulE/Tfp pilus assembly ATPase PilB-like protein
MRLDPDVIMLGEVRDGASARLAVQAAMTGHQVWTTVHANSAISIIDRLIDLGIQIELMTDPTIISGLVCQRLVQVLCEHCKIPIIDAAHRYSPRDMERMMGAITLDGTYVKGDGCEKCRNSGIAGRTVVSETIVPNQKFMSYIRRGDRVGAIGYWKTQMGGKDMLSDAIAKVATGTVDPFSAEDVVGPLNAEKIEVDSHD